MDIGGFITWPHLVNWLTDTYVTDLALNYAVEKFDKWFRNPPSQFFQLHERKIGVEKELEETFTEQKL